MLDDIPNFIVHYSRGEPFRSITSVCHEDLAGVIATLDETNALGLSRFSDPQYLSQRYQTEKYLRERFIEIGGHPILQNPIYFFLGRHARFEEHERNLGYFIQLQDIDPRSVSFTYGDSMLCFNDQNRQQSGERYRNPLCENLYSLADLPQLFAHPGFPKTERLHIEAHLWITPDPKSVHQKMRTR